MAFLALARVAFFLVFGAAFFLLAEAGFFSPRALILPRTEASERPSIFAISDAGFDLYAERSLLTSAADHEVPTEALAFLVTFLLALVFGLAFFVVFRFAAVLLLAGITDSFPQYG